MITLKKSFELQNYMKSLMDDVLHYLTIEDNVTTTVQKHMRTKTYAEAIDEEKVKERPSDHPFTPNQLIEFAEGLAKEIELLTYAINKGKVAGDKDYDGMVSVNNKKRLLLRHLESIAKIKASERTTRGTAEKFNETGEQTTYRYEIQEVTTIDFDRNNVKKIVKKLRAELEKASTEIELMGITTEIDYEPIFDIGDSFDDAVMSYIEPRK